MKKAAFYLVLLFSFALIGCTSTQFATYRAPGMSEQWNINVEYKEGITDNFKLLINDQIVINETANVLTGSLEKITTYQDKQIKLLVTFTPGFLGIGKGYETLVFINNELAGKFKF